MFVMITMVAKSAKLKAPLWWWSFSILFVTQARAAYDVSEDKDRMQF